MTNFDYTCNYYYFTVQKPNKTKTNNMVDEKTKQNTHTQKKKTVTKLNTYSRVSISSCMYWKNRTEIGNVPTIIASKSFFSYFTSSIS